MELLTFSYYKMCICPFPQHGVPRTKVLNKTSNISKSVTRGIPDFLLSRPVMYNNQLDKYKGHMLLDSSLKAFFSGGGHEDIHNR